jgi:hypothetical protein
MINDGGCSTLFDGGEKYSFSKFVRIGAFHFNIC